MDTLDDADCKLSIPGLAISSFSDVEIVSVDDSKCRDASKTLAQ